MGGRHSIAGMRSQSNVDTYRCENKKHDRIDEPELGDSSEVDLPDRLARCHNDRIRTGRTRQGRTDSNYVILCNLKLHRLLISV